MKKNFFVADMPQGGRACSRARGGVEGGGRGRGAGVEGQSPAADRDAAAFSSRDFR